MKATNLLLTILLLALTALALVPALQAQSNLLVGAAAVLALILVVLQLAGSTEAKSPPTPAEAAKPVAPAPAPRPEAEIVSLLAVLQEKGRLIDFLMDDITAYDDGQVGAAARVVHQGCKQVLTTHFTIEPVSNGSEGASVTVPEPHEADEYRLTGNVTGEPPFSGTLAHKGWKATAVKLPRLLDSVITSDRLPVIAPAEVEIK